MSLNLNRPAPVGTDTTYRVSTQALSSSDAAVLQTLMRTVKCGSKWEFVTTGYDMAFVDPVNPAANVQLRERPLGSLVVLALPPGRQPLPGALALRLPFCAEEVQKTLRDAERLLEQRIGILRSNGRVESKTLGVSRPSDPAKGTTLFDVAVDLRACLQKRTDCFLELDGMRYELSPQRALYVSSSSPSFFSAYRGRSVDRFLTGALLGSRLNGVQPRRLEDLLWSIGYYAGNGSLLPWLSPGERYKITRWLSMLGYTNRALLFRIAAVLGRAAYKPEEAAAHSQASVADVNDFLNACSMAGCLDSTQPARPPAATIAPAVPDEAPKVTRSLLQRIRVKLGLGA